MDGFLHHVIASRSQSFMLDLVVVAMAAVLLVMAYSIHLAKTGKLSIHQRIQLILTVILLVVITAFEIDMRLNGWAQGVTPDGSVPVPVGITLAIHILISVSTLVLWGMAVFSGWRLSKQPAAGPEQRRRHRRNGKLAALGMLMTTLTGWLFYALAFIVVWE